GLHEPIVIEIPKGGYTPLFHTRDAAQLEDRPSNGQVQQHALWKSRVKPLLAVLAVCAAAMIVFLAFTRVHSDATATAGPGTEPRPTVDRLWHQMFANGRQTCLVLSDSALTMFEDMLHRQIDLNEYRKKEFATLADEEL